MRMGVLDVGSNTAHLLLVDAHPGARLCPVHSERVVLRLAEQIDRGGALTSLGEKSLVEAVAAAGATAARLGAEDLVVFVTSAVRDATNGSRVVARVAAETGVRLAVLSGADEARLTFLAVRRWFGWSAGRLLVLDIGGGSVEMAGGADEEPADVVSLPLGAGRLTRERLGIEPGAQAPPSAQAVTELREYVDALLDPVAGRMVEVGWDCPVATSKTLRTLARLTGATSSGTGSLARRRLTRAGLRRLIGFIRHISPAGLTELDGVSVDRAHQLLAGAVTAEAVMRRLDLNGLEICPWALREGAILHRLDQLRSEFRSGGL